MAAQNAEYWIDRLGLIAHPEGGYFKETFRSPEILQEDSLGQGYIGSRNASTAIYFLVTAEKPSHFHRLATDEIWHHYAGDALELIFIHPNGDLESKWLGKSDAKGCMPQLARLAKSSCCIRITFQIRCLSDCPRTGNASSGSDSVG